MKLLKMACLAAAIVTAPGAALAEEWILASPYPDSSYVTANTRTFADDVRKATGGKVDIKVHAGASLYKLPEIKRAVQTRQIAAGEVLLGSMTNEDPVYGIAMMPFLTKDIDDAKRLWAASRPFTEARMAKAGLKLLYITCWPGQSLLTRKPVNSFADLKGTKFRVQDPNTAELVKQMGATGVRVETADIPQAFLTGIIDGMYTSNETTATLKGWDYVRHAYETNAWYPLNVIFMNLAQWNSLDPETQAAVSKAANAAEERSFDMAKAATDKANKLLTEHGVEVTAPSAALMTEFQKIGATMLEGWKKQAGADGDALLKAFQTSRGN